MSSRYRKFPRRRYGAEASETLPLPQPSTLSKQFQVDDIAGSTVVGSLLNTILESFAGGRPIHQAKMKFLRDRGADALADLIEKSISEADFAARATDERTLRIEVARQQAEAAEAAKRAEAEHAAEERRIESERQEAIRLRIETQREAERVLREASPEFIAKRKNRGLLRKYEIVEYVEPPDFIRLLQILNALETGSRLNTKDVVWLHAMTQERGCRFHRVLHAHHRREADAYISEFQRDADPWQAINASAHLRKCEASWEAIDLLKAVPETRLKHPKVKSAMLTTYGGASRDVGRFDDAGLLGEKAHALLPEDFRPCTLLGAVHIQQGHYELGHEWYRKAEARGAKRDSIESEIRALLRSMPAEEQSAAKQELRRIDPNRYRNL